MPSITTILLIICLAILLLTGLGLVRLYLISRDGEGLLEYFFNQGVLSAWESEGRVRLEHQKARSVPAIATAWKHLLAAIYPREDAYGQRQLECEDSAIQNFCREALEAGVSELARVRIIQPVLLGLSTLGGVFGLSHGLISFRQSLVRWPNSLGRAFSFLAESCFNALLVIACAMVCTLVLFSMSRWIRERLRLRIEILEGYLRARVKIVEGKYVMPEGAITSPNELQSVQKVIRVAFEGQFSWVSDFKELNRRMIDILEYFQRDESNRKGEMAQQRQEVFQVVKELIHNLKALNNPRHEEFRSFAQSITETLDLIARKASSQSTEDDTQLLGTLNDIARAQLEATKELSDNLGLKLEGIAQNYLAKQHEYSKQLADMFHELKSKLDREDDPKPLHDLVKAINDFSSLNQRELSDLRDSFDKELSALAYSEGHNRSLSEKTLTVLKGMAQSLNEMQHSSEGLHDALKAKLDLSKVEESVDTGVQGIKRMDAKLDEFASQTATELAKKDVSVALGKIQGTLTEHLGELSKIRVAALKAAPKARRSGTRKAKPEEETIASDVLSQIVEANELLHDVLRSLFIVNEQRSTFERACARFCNNLASLKLEPKNDGKVKERLSVVSAQVSKLRRGLAAVAYLQGHALEVTIKQLEHLAKRFSGELNRLSPNKRESVERMWRSSQVVREVAKARDLLNQDIARLSKVYLKAQDGIGQLLDLSQLRRVVDKAQLNEMESAAKRLCHNSKRFEYPTELYGNGFIPEVNSLKSIVKNSERILSSQSHTLRSGSRKKKAKRSA